MTEHFCSGCVEDVKWFIENDLICVDADSGEMPRSVEWVIRDDSEKIMRTGWANLNTLHGRAHEIDDEEPDSILPHDEEQKILRRCSYLRWEELLDSDLPDDVKMIIMDRWDFSRAPKTAA